MNKLGLRVPAWRMTWWSVGLCHSVFGFFLVEWAALVGHGCCLHYKQVWKSWAILQRTFGDGEQPQQCSEVRLQMEHLCSRLGIQLHTSAQPWALTRPNGLIGCPGVWPCQEVSNKKLIFLMVSLVGVGSEGRLVGTRCARWGPCGISWASSYPPKEKNFPFLQAAALNNFPDTQKACFSFFLALL